MPAECLAWLLVMYFDPHPNIWFNSRIISRLSTIPIRLCVVYTASSVDSITDKLYSILLCSAARVWCRQCFGKARSRNRVKICSAFRCGNSRLREGLWLDAEVASFILDRWVILVLLCFTEIIGAVCVGLSYKNGARPFWGRGVFILVISNVNIGYQKSLTPPLRAVLAQVLHDPLY